jgi:rhodanese-related sulfurtransferase
LSGYSPSLGPVEALNAIRKSGAVILDVRTVGEQSRAPLSGVVHIPADELRDRPEEVPRGKPVFVLSKDGFLGHTTLQVLKANGWKDVTNITGGYAAARWVEGWKFGE